MGYARAYSAGPKLVVDIRVRCFVPGSTYSVGGQRCGAPGLIGDAAAGHFSLTSALHISLLLANWFRRHLVTCQRSMMRTMPINVWSEPRATGVLGRPWGRALLLFPLVYRLVQDKAPELLCRAHAARASEWDDSLSRAGRCGRGSPCMSVILTSRSGLV